MEKGYYINKYRSATRRKPTIIELVLYGSEGGTGYPQVRIMVNNKIYFEKIVEQRQNIKFTIDEIKTRNIISIEMIGKVQKDTVLRGGEIIKDKNLKIEKILLDDVNIKNYIYKGRQRPVYHYENQGPQITKGNQLFFSGQWKLYFKNPARLFLAYINACGQKINEPEKQSIKNKYFQQVISSINLHNVKKYR